MRIMKTAMMVSLLVLLGACAPHRHDQWHRGDQYRGGGMHHGGHAGMMMGGCGPGSCTYRSRCFSNGAINSNGGVCQSCTDGRWVAASGCTEHECHHCDRCGMGKGKKSGPCHGHGEKRGGRPPAHER
jgi:hypothetical protein